MGKLIRNGIEYGGGNGTDIFEVDQDTYDALKQAGTLVHNALYVISDAPNLNPTASDIEYSSGVTVKQAIDNGVGVSRPTIEVTTGNTLTYNNSVKYGKMISITVVIRVGTVSANTHTHIATVTEKPVDTSVTVPSVNGTNGTYGGMINIAQSNGNINLYSPTALSNVNIGFTTTYYQA